MPSSGRWTPPPCTGTPPPALPTAGSSAWAVKWASPPRSSTPGARWAWRSCVPLSLSPGGAVRSGKHFSGFLPFPGDNGPGRGYYDVGGIGCSGDHSCKKRPLGWNGLKTLHLNRANLPCKFWISMLVSLFSTHYNRDRARPADVLLDAGSPRLVRGAVYHIPTTAV